jgi:hypothetical protein
MNSQQPQPTPVEPTTPLSVTLEAQQWNALLAVVQDAAAPYRVTAPLIQAIGEQLQRGAAGASSAMPPPQLVTS